MKLSVLLIIGGVIVASDAFALPPQVPNPSLTPGAVMTTDRGKICTPGYSKTVRNVPEAEKVAVYREYGIRSHRAGEYEVDHLISLELGGSNDVANLWPQSYVSEPFNAHIKDKLENRLHSMVCNGRISIEEAQREIATDQTRRLEIVTQDDKLFRFIEYGWLSDEEYSHWSPTHYSGVYGDAEAAERDAVAIFDWLSNPKPTAGALTR